MRWLTLNPEPLKFRFRFSDEAAPPLDRLLHAEARVSSKNPVRPVKVVRGFSFLEFTPRDPDPIVGIAELRRLRPLTDRPLVAIGGITRANAQSVLNAGADSVAIIGDLFAEDRNVRTRTEEWVSLTRDTQNV